MSSVASKSELLNVLGDVKARVQDKLGIVDFPMPQFILIGKQSVGKSSLIEALAGERFNFTSGTLGSRRPTVLEFRNVLGTRASRWSVRDRTTNRWVEHALAEVIKLVEAAHEELGNSVSDEPIHVRIESATCPDMQIVDLPGFREFASDPAKQELSDSITKLGMSFMTDRRNVILCVEQAGDSATMSTLQKCREIDPRFERTILVRNKLDKYYGDLAPDNIHKWVDGCGDLPANLCRFALTLPWQVIQGKTLAEQREEVNMEDIRQVTAKGLSPKCMGGIGFNNFASYMERKIEQLFAMSIGPVMSNLHSLRDSTERKKKELTTEIAETNPNRILSTTRDCGASFATALRHVMAGVLNLPEGRLTLEEELKDFHRHHNAAGSNHFSVLPSDFEGLGDYTSFLRDEIKISAFDVEVNGGAQFRRLMVEVEIFLRFSEIREETNKQDVIQARGVSMGSLTWRDVVVKLLSNDAHVPLQRKLLYVGERIKWFFKQQKDVITEFMDSLDGTPIGNMYSPLYPKHAKLIKQNDLIRHLVYSTYDAACEHQMKQFIELFENMLTSTFSNPWVFLKGATLNASQQGTNDDLADLALPSFEDTKERIPGELKKRAGVEDVLAQWLQQIPMGAHEIDSAVDMVQKLVLKTYSFIRSQVCDQVEMFAESFFKLPMLRRLEMDMSKIELSESSKHKYEVRRDRLRDELLACEGHLDDLHECVDKLQAFKLKCDNREVRA